jgi:membrane-bound metal-dependent hydrolase YbcI (DUF457 family)
MDPLTHALLGATVAQAALGPRLGRRAWLPGALGGVLPDIDILIRSSTDPLLAIEYHRQFTHALVFIPVGGLVAASPWLLQQRYRADWRPLLAAATLGYATHGVLDACTNYGTHLLWPFLPWRVAWHWITTIGPLLTLILLGGLVLALRRQSRTPALLALLLGVGYVGTAAWQRERALAMQAPLAAARGHPVVRAEMFPTVGNPVLWRSVYQSIRCAPMPSNRSGAFASTQGLTPPPSGSIARPATASRSAKSRSHARLSLPPAADSRSGDRHARGLLLFGWLLALARADRRRPAVDQSGLAAAPFAAVSCRPARGHPASASRRRRMAAAAALAAVSTVLTLALTALVMRLCARRAVTGE